MVLSSQRKCTQYTPYLAKYGLLRTILAKEDSFIHMIMIIDSGHHSFSWFYSQPPAA